MSEYQTPSPRFRVDWTIPVWGVLGLLVQAIGIVWFAATLNAKVADSRDRIDKLEVRVAAVESMGPTLARLDERTKWIYDNVRGDRQ